MNFLLQHALVALPATLGFALVARRLRGVTTSGAVAGWVVALLLWLAAGWQAFVVLLALFVLTLAATRFGYPHKLALRTAERRSGRDAAQVVANVGVAGLLALALPPAWLVGAMAVLAECAADTVSSEIGQAVGGTPRLITTGQRVAPGTDGGLTLVGTAAGILAAAVLAALACGLRLLDARAAGIAVLAATVGMFCDSLLGATLERRGRMNNNQVNGASTACAALVAVAAMWAA